MNERINIADKKPDAKSQNLASQIRRKTESFQSMNSPVDLILFLQRTIGNQAVGRLIKSGALQARLRIGQPGDTYEQEANRVAEQVMRMPAPVQRKCSECEDEVRRQPIEEEEEELQAKPASGNIPEVQPDIESHIHSLKGGGQPLSENDRAFFEPRFGRDFSQVRVHADAKAAEAAREVNAQAFTVGKDVVFGAGEYAPGTSEGRKLLAHELTHVVQQTRNYSSFSGSLVTGCVNRAYRRSPVSAESNALQMVPLESGRNVRVRCGALGCPLTINPPGKIACAVVDCGRGSCPICPPPYRNIVFRAWCSYSCLPSGSCFLFITALGNYSLGPFCFD